VTEPPIHLLRRGSHAGLVGDVEPEGRRLEALASEPFCGFFDGGGVTGAEDDVLTVNGETARPRAVAWLPSRLAVNAARRISRKVRPVISPEFPRRSCRYRLRRKRMP
jgi:hypothetical protein